MKIRAKYWALMRDGRRINVCIYHLDTVARRTDIMGRLSLKRGVAKIGSLHPFTSRICGECAHDSH